MLYQRTLPRFSQLRVYEIYRTMLEQISLVFGLKTLSPNPANTCNNQECIYLCFWLCNLDLNQGQFTKRQE